MKGVVLQTMLGHTSFEVTRKFYLDVSTNDLKAEHDLYSPMDRLAHNLKTGGQISGTPLSIPEAHILAQEVACSNFSAVGRKYSVSDTAIRKRLKKAGLLL